LPVSRRITTAQQENVPHGVIYHDKHGLRSLVYSGHSCVGVPGTGRENALKTISVK
jgi:hypothetical protein